MPQPLNYSQSGDGRNEYHLCIFGTWALSFALFTWRIQVLIEKIRDTRILIKVRGLVSHHFLVSWLLLFEEWVTLLNPRLFPLLSNMRKVFHGQCCSGTQDLWVRISAYRTLKWRNNSSMPLLLCLGLCPNFSPKFIRAQPRIWAETQLIR